MSLHELGAIRRVGVVVGIRVPPLPGQRSVRPAVPGTALDESQGVAGHSVFVRQLRKLNLSIDIKRSIKTSV
jgi:hypothetical protein